MNFVQALICGIFYYLNASPWVMGAGFYTIGKPLVLGFLVGLILGDPVQGTIAGATIQLIYLGVMSTGGSYPADAGLAGIIGTASVILGGLSTSEAVAVAVPIGLAGTVLYQLRMLSAVPFTHLADKAAEEGNSKKLFFANIVGPQIALAAIYVIPCTLACYYGVDAISALINMLAGTKILSVLSTVGGMLAVIGIAMNMKAIFKGDARPFFFIGFLLVVYLNFNMIAISCFALLFAIVYIQLKPDNKEVTVMEDEDDD
ncbi:MAG: PTS mannose/fructose/sorbose/N-acetylgalactosamine transporter subunit IIC [Erysipelotrichaceae bacterium]